MTTTTAQPLETMSRPHSSATTADPSAGIVGWAELGYVPDALLRRAVRARCRSRRKQQAPDDVERRAELLARHIAALDASPLAPVPEKANAQHYEVPARFFELVLGPRRKYSSCWWPDDRSDLARAEEAALATTCERAELAPGQRILELGCGWGSLTLWMAEHYPTSSIVAVSNSTSQRHAITSLAARRGLTNIEVLTADINSFQAPGRFDRVVSVEMFEHVRNYRELFRHIQQWLAPGGKLFTHIFCNRDAPYIFDDQLQSDWLGRYFFTGGQMPSFDLLPSFQDHLLLERTWAWSGEHYQRTAEAWLANLDRQRAEVMPILTETYGVDARRWFGRWRMFFIACAELFGFERGQRWFVGHYRFAHRA